MSDPTLKRYFEGREKEIFSYIENDLSFGDRHLLGEGATAKVKAYYFETSEVAVPMAVKYVLTPIQGTVSAAEEYRILGEVEKIREIEKLESKDADKHVHVRVPHPYFQYESTKVQCYGMELVQGLTLHQVIEGDWIDEEQREKIKAALAGLSREQIQQEFEIFINNIHEYYLHNDIKPANIMISEEGIFYIIDFGQSEALVNMPGKTPEQIQSLKQDEVMKTKLAITRFFQAIR